jgi:hypothetical protein
MKRLLPLLVIFFWTGCSVDLLGDDTWCSGPLSFSTPGAVLQMVVGDSTMLQVQRAVVDGLSGECGLAFPPAYQFAWQSTNMLVASVDNRGVVNALAPGEATISVTPFGSAAKAAQQRVAVRVP